MEKIATMGVPDNTPPPPSYNDATRYDQGPTDPKGTPYPQGTPNPQGTPYPQGNPYPQGTPYPQDPQRPQIPQSFYANQNSLNQQAPPYAGPPHTNQVLVVCDATAIEKARQEAFRRRCAIWGTIIGIKVVIAIIVVIVLTSSN